MNLSAVVAFSGSDFSDFWPSQVAFSASGGTVNITMPVLVFWPLVVIMLLNMVQLIVLILRAFLFVALTLAQLIPLWEAISFLKRLLQTHQFDDDPGNPLVSTASIAVPSILVTKSCLRTGRYHNDASCPSLYGGCVSLELCSKCAKD
jgi:hypothetical protein